MTYRASLGGIASPFDRMSYVSRAKARARAASVQRG